MFEGSLQMMSSYRAAVGYTLDRDGLANRGALSGKVGRSLVASTAHRTRLAPTAGAQGQRMPSEAFVKYTSKRLESAHTRA